MKYVDLNEDLNDYLTDDKRKIPQEYLDSVCKIYQKHDTCRYIFLSPIGYICMKNSPMKAELDRLASNKKMISTLFLIILDIFTHSPVDF